MPELFPAPFFEDTAVEGRRRRVLQPVLTLASFPEIRQLIHRLLNFFNHF